MGELGRRTVSTIAIAARTKSDPRQYQVVTRAVNLVTSMRVAVIRAMARSAMLDMPAWHTLRLTSDDSRLSGLLHLCRALQTVLLRCEYLIEYT